MQIGFRGLAGSVFALVVSACGDNHEVVVPDAEPVPDAFVASCRDADLEGSLRAVPGVTTATETACGDYVTPPARCFSVFFDQPIDHDDPQSKRFAQQLFLMHRGCDNANLVADWGYSNQYFFDDELSVLYETNSLWIEHRFQGESVPAPEDWKWTSLTIENGAKDMHRIVTAFKQHYGGRWVSTGASKGGITATYHTYFFPDDLDGSIPYVAPASRARLDPEYQTFLSASLPSPCAQQIRDAQVAALTSRRAMMLQRLSAQYPGAEPLVLEFMVGSFDWGFWQYYGMEFCELVPASTATDAAFWQFFAEISGLGPMAAPGPDEDLSYGALYYEWLTEQGFALQVGPHVEELLVEPVARQTMEESFREQFPGVPLPAYDGSVTAAARTWARDEAENLLLIYGQYDPWSGAALDVPAKPTSARFFVPGATHGAAIADLDEGDKLAALAHASRMFDREPVMPMMAAARRAATVRQAILDRTIRRHEAVRLHRVGATRAN